MPNGIAYMIKRTMRKTVMLRITKDATLEVVAPLRMKPAVIEQFVLEKKEWVQKNIAKQQQVMAERAAYGLEEIFFLGKAYIVKPHEGKKVLLLDDALLVLNLPLEERRKKVLQWYKGQAKQILPRRAAVFAEKMGAAYQAIKITSAKTRWGSCTGKGNINFSWRLMAAPADAIDYVVIHELAHLRHMDHSEAFWGEVETYCKNYKAMKTLLKDVQERLIAQGW